MDSQDFVTNLTDRKVWYRILCMLLYGFIFYLIETAVLVIAVFQVIYRIFMNEPHQQLKQVSKDLAVYINQLVEYLLFNADYQPFPIGEWPSQGQEPQPRSESTRESRPEPRPEPKRSEPKPAQPEQKDEKKEPEV